MMQAVQVMSDFQAIAMFVGIFLLFIIPIFWWQFHEGSSGKNKAAEELFRKRQLNPDFEAFRQHFGCEPPQALKSLFAEPELFTNDKDIFEIAVPSETGQEKRWFVAWIDAIDKEHLKSRNWPGTEGFYAFANNGAGDQYLIDPKQEDPEVFYYEHETGKKKSVGVTLSQFVSAKRIYG
jgi:hypothetical protein